MIAIKESVQLCPWADMVYGCDPAWWKHRQGLTDFKGVRVAWSGADIEQGGILRIEIDKAGSEYTNRMTFDQVGRVGGGGNSGFQALNLVAQLGARRVILIGFDMHGRSGPHWYGRNNWNGANNPQDHNFRRWRTAMDAAGPVLAERGVEVINASPNSDIKAFRRGEIAETLQQWGA